MTLKSWLYILRDRNTGEYIYMDTAGNVTYTTSPTALAYTPDGWQKKSIAWERDLNKFGLVRTFTVNLNFVLDGKTLIDKIALQQSFESPIQLIIQKLKFNTTGNAFEYIDFYIGELNLTALESDEIKVSIPIVEGGVAKLLSANENTVYEFDMDSTVEMDGITLSERGNMSGIDSLEIAYTAVGSFFDVPIAHLSTDGQSSGIAFFTQELKAVSYVGGSGWEDRLADINYLASASDVNTGTINARVRGSLKITITNRVASNVTLGFRFLRSNQLSANQADYALPGLGEQPIQGKDYVIPFDMTIPLQPGEKLFLEGRINMVAGTELKFEFLRDSDFSIEFSNRYKTTYCKAISAWNLFKKIVGKITGDESNAQSSLLQSNQNILISCGDAIREVTNAKIKTSLSEFHKFCRAIFLAGIGVEDGKIVIESITYFYKTTSPVSLGECRGFKWKPADDLLFNTIKVGYPVKDISGANGKYSSHNTQVYSIPIQSTSKALEIISPYTACPFYIEITRINLEGKTTTDNEADNDVMILNTEADTTTLNPTDVLIDTATDGAYFSFNDIDDSMDKFKTSFTVSGTVSNNSTFTVKNIVEGAGTFNVYVNEPVTTEVVTSGMVVEITIYKLLRETYVSNDITVTGVPDLASLFNIVYLTPRRILKRWMPYINSVLFQFTGVDITFESTEKNRELKTDDGSTVIDEDADEPIGGTRIFKALYYNLETTVDDIVPETLSSDPNSGFSVVNPVNGRTFTGILVKAAMAAEEQTAQSFRLLAGADEDENNLL